MNKLTVFQRQASTGMIVTLRLTRGEDVTGRITELDEYHVCVDVGHRIVTVFDEILAGWDIHSEALEPTNAEAPTGQSALEASAQPPPPHQTPKDKLSSASPSPSPSLAIDPEVLARRARIDASYSEGTKRARLEPPQPDFSFSDGDFPATSVPDIRRELNRARNQYEYALKVREESRLVNIVGQALQPLIEKYPRSASLQVVLGCLLLKLGRQTEAIEHLRLAALTSRNPDHWHALAYAGAGSAIECYALRSYFLVRRPDEAREAWLRYITVALSYSDGTGMVRVLEPYFSLEQGSPPQEAAAETLIYVLGQIGATDAALSATLALVRGEAFPPDGWRDLIMRALAAPSEELAREQERDAVPSPSSRRTPSVPSGRIVSFGNQRFGFIENTDGEMHFFRIDDIADDHLKQELLDGAWRRHADVEFRVVPSPGHRYHRATEVLPFLDIDALLERAQSLMRLNQHPQAMSLVRRALSTNPEHPFAVKLEAKIRDQMKRALSLGVGLPKGNGPFARGKRAQLVDQNLPEAERLFREAIRRGDSTESAVNDLASLLQQLGRSGEAVSLLEDKRKRYSGVSPYDNPLATLLQQTGRHDEAVRILDELFRQATLKARPALLRRIAFSQFKGGHYDEAEATLRRLLLAAPGDSLAERWLAGLEQARRSGSYAQAGEIIGGFSSLAEEGLDLSPLARGAIEACSFEGVDPIKLQAGAVTAKDVERLEELAKELGTKRPRDRAAYYLSAAAILSRQSSEEAAARIYDYLRRYFASMGDAAWVAKQPADVARSYYTESLALVSEPGDESWRTLLRYLATYVPTHQGEVEQSIQNSRRYRDTLRMVLNTIRREAPSVLFDALLEVSSLSRFASEAILAGVKTLPDVQECLSSRLAVNGVTDVPELARAWTACCSQRSRSRDQADALCGTMTRHQLTAASVEDLVIQMRSLSHHFLPELDKRRLGDLLDIAESSLRFCRATDFEEKEQHYWFATTRAKGFHNDVTEAPTRFAHAGLLPVSEHLRSLIEEQYAQTARTSAAQLNVRLLVDHYVRGSQGEVRLQFEVANKQGCSPASSVRLVSGPSDSPYFEASKSDIEVASTLRGGATVVSHVTLKLCERAANEPAFPISVRAKYLSRVGEGCWTEDSQWTVRLYGEQEFQAIPNPYSPYAEGGPVDDPAMFVGRDGLLEQLSHSLLSGSASKCVVVFGQKRAGKSSVLEHLRRRLLNKGGCLPIQFSLYEIGPGLNESAFFFQILRSISDALAGYRESCATAPEYSCPSLDDLRQHPVLRFHEAMSSLAHELRRGLGERGLLLVLLIDEFTEVFKQIRKGIIKPEFMKAWKAVVERRYFASVLVGQDIMPAFKATFPNEFGVTEDVRVTYLPEADARRLIVEPVGLDHYVGNAVDRILGVTAGSPFYTMMFCSRLVEYMNRTRSAVVTEADIAAVAQEMVSGDRRLTKDKFDNLICAGDGMVDSGIEPDETFQICKEIARSGHRGWCARDTLRSYEREKVNFLLTDLERRDVIERKGDACRLRVGLFSDWLLVQG